MGVLVSGMGVGYLSKRWKRSSSDGSTGSKVGPLLVSRVLRIINEIIQCNECAKMKIYIWR